MILAPIRLEPPPPSPVSLEQVRAHLRIDHTDEDATLQTYIDAAADYIDGETGILGRAVTTQSWRQYYPAFTDPLVLPLGLAPVQTVDEIRYFDPASAEAILDPALYRLVQTTAGAVIEPIPPAWPETAVRADAVSVEFTAGQKPADLPATIRQALLLLIGHWYCEREAASAANLKDIPYAVRSLLINRARITF